MFYINGLMCNNHGLIYLGVIKTLTRINVINSVIGCFLCFLRILLLGIIWPNISYESFFIGNFRFDKECKTVWVLKNWTLITDSYWDVLGKGHIWLSVLLSLSPNLVIFLWNSRWNSDRNIMHFNSGVSDRLDRFKCVNHLPSWPHPRGKRFKS